MRERERSGQGNPAVEIRREGARAIASLGGDWTTPRLRQGAVALAALPGDGELAVDMGGIALLDTNGAWLIQRALRQAADRGAQVAVEHVDPRHAPLIETVAAAATIPAEPAPRHRVLSDFVARLGRNTIAHGKNTADLVGFLGMTVAHTAGSLIHPGRLRVAALFSHMERTGLNALPIVGLLSFLIGVVFAYQGAAQLQRFGAEIFTVNLVGIGVLREMGPLLTAIIVAGRSGSAFTAEIGTMQVNEEVDALRTIGLDPMDVLVLPRLGALLIAVPLLVFYADMMGVLGGAVMANLALDIGFVQFFQRLNATVPIDHFWLGMVKAPLFAFIIGMVGCYEGLKVERNAESVGRRTTRAVVESIFIVILLDAVLSILYAKLGV